MALCSFIGKKPPVLAEKNAKNAIRRTAGDPTDLSRKPRHLPVIMKRFRSPNCGSVHHTAYYFTGGKRESQAKFHKNVKISVDGFDKWASGCVPGSPKGASGGGSSANGDCGREKRGMSGEKARLFPGFSLGKRKNCLNFGEKIFSGAPFIAIMHKSGKNILKHGKTRTFTNKTERFVEICVMVI